MKHTETKLEWDVPSSRSEVDQPYRYSTCTGRSVARSSASGHVGFRLENSQFRVVSYF